MPKPTIVMVHGIVGSLDYFSPATRLPDFTVYTPDLSGYGALRDARDDALDLAAQAAHVIEQIEACADEPVWLLGHSMGGAIAMLAADRRPELIRGLINVEGNFTLLDAFWSRSIAAMSREEWEQRYTSMRGDVPRWLLQCGVKPTAKRVEWTTGILDNQPAATVRTMSVTLVESTAEPAYMEAVRRVCERGIAIHLIAGQRSAADWDVPCFIREAASTDTQIENTGHLMMLEAPDAFCQAVRSVALSTR